MIKNRTYEELIQQVIFRNPKLFKSEPLVNEVINMLAELVYEDAQAHTETDDMVICLLYDKGKEMYQDKTNH